MSIPWVGSDTKKYPDPGSAPWPDIPSADCRRKDFRPAGGCPYSGYPVLFNHLLRMFLCLPCCHTIRIQPIFFRNLLLVCIEKNNILFNALFQKQAHALPVLRYKGHIMLWRHPQIVRFMVFPLIMTGPLRRKKTHDSIGNSQFSLSGQAADAKYLPLRISRSIPFTCSPRHIHIIISQADGNLLLIETRLSSTVFLHQLLHLPANHQLRNLRYVGILNPCGQQTLRL